MSAAGELRHQASLAKPGLSSQQDDATLFTLCILESAGEDRVLPMTGEMLVPRWSDDGTQLAFRRLTPVDSDPAARTNAIVLVGADGTNERNLTTPGLLEFTPYGAGARLRARLGGEELALTEVSDAVNDVRNDGPGLLESPLRLF